MPPKRKRPNHDSNQVAPAPTTRRATRQTPNPAPLAKPPKSPAVKTAPSPGPKTRRGRAAQPAAPAMARKQTRGTVPNGESRDASGPRYTQTTLKWAADGANTRGGDGAPGGTLPTASTEDAGLSQAQKAAPSSRRAVQPAQPDTNPPQPTPTDTKRPPTADRNIDKVVLGNICFKTWYPSYYGKEVLGDATRDASGKTAKKGEHAEPTLSRLYVCPCCFKYSKELVPWWEHVRACEARNVVPGRQVYVHPRRRAAPEGKGKRRRGEAVARGEDEGEWSVWEVDGAEDGLFCQNLSLFAKLFLDNKSVFFDVTGFTYFLLVFSRPDPSAPGTPPKRQICGFFSKEKLSWDNNNLACILVFPPWQRKGLGSLLMGVSYEISRREGVMGGPEKPISELGRKGYGRFWAGEIARWVLSEGEAVVDVEECSEATWIAPEDCLGVLRDMGVVEEDGLGPGKVRGDAGEDGEGKEEELVPRVRIAKDDVRAWVERQRIGLERACDPEGFAGWYVEELGRKAAAARAGGSD